DAKKAAEEAKKQAADEAKKAAEDAKKEAAAEAKKQAAADAKAKADTEAKAAAAAKKAADAKKKADAAAAAKAAEGVDDLFDGLADGKNAPKGGGAAGAAGTSGKAGAAGKGNSKTSGASGADISNYAGQIQAAIESKFHTDPSFSGKVCNLRIKLASDGMLLSVTSEGGDPALCQAAVAAARMAKYPKPPSDAIYQIFKNAPVDFKPN
ncbi:MAG: cell envelope integrity protein TolA, partial [Enterobacterales bacterium]|nr:cell envelope integrity protein TolA [Enterobacterales bacterium]